MSEHIRLNRTPKRYPIIISIMHPGMARIVTLRGSNYHRLEQIFMVAKGFEPCIYWIVSVLKVPCQGTSGY